MPHMRYPTHMSEGRIRVRLKRVITVFGEAEFKEIQKYAEKHKLSMYGLAKKAIRDFIRKNP